MGISHGSKLFSKTFPQLVRDNRAMSILESLNFDNLALRTLPIDPEEGNYVRQVSGACFSKVLPEPVKKPKLVCCSKPALALLGIGEEDIERPDFVQYFSGNVLLPGMDSAAHCYCGHQFGYFSGQLGDGAAMYLGEVINKDQERWEIQFKGSGKTPYSRQADGRKVLRSSVREFLCSEAIHHLGIPTTRAGTCVTSESTVVRDIFYDGHPIYEKCTVILRIAPTFLRFGSFEIFKPLSRETGRMGPSVGRKDILIQMLDYTVGTFYPEIWEKFSADKQKMYTEFYIEVLRRTARLVAEWQCVGWCHGVLNTDNMSIMGLTIDYGPFGFMDRYDPSYICNGSDDGGRYAYNKQPEICRWNCEKLAEAIQEAVPLSMTKQHLSVYDEEFSRCYKQKMRQKLGLIHKELEADGNLVESFLDTMEKSGADFTNCFRCLSRLPLPGTQNFVSALSEVTEYILSQCATVENLKQTYEPQMDPRQLQMLLMLMETNPGIASALGRGVASLSGELHRMEKSKKLQDLTEEQKTQENRELWTTWLTKYTARLKEDVEGLTDLNIAGLERVKVMNSVNPRFILRNYIADNAIKAAEKGDFSEVRRVLNLLENPYSDDAGVTPQTSSSTLEVSGASESRQFSTQMYDCKPPDWSLGLRVT